ncbi:MAG: SO_0444 family Cu/Zn efflux transporter [Candidatus Zixiibacteriota bacterium]
MLFDYLNNLFQVINDSAFYLLFGFLLAGLIHEFVSSQKLARHLGKSNFGSILKASLIGTPLPLCSCGVIPTAIGLRKDGASKESTVSFLIATPETGVDSISLSYALLDPLLTIFRPIAAVITSIFAGLAEKVFGRREEVENLKLEGKEGCCDEDDECLEEAKDTSDRRPRHRRGSNFLGRVENSLRYGFITFFGDIVIYIVIGYVLAALISTVVPQSFMAEYLGGEGILPMLAMIAVGIPLYICSTSATPIASALVLKGASPGAALVLLLVGPATNVATMVAVGKFLGKRSLILYLLSIIVLSLLLAFFLNFVYTVFKISPTASLGQGAELIPNWLKIISNIMFIILTLWVIARKIKK